MLDELVHSNRKAEGHANLIARHSERLATATESVNQEVSGIGLQVKSLNNAVSDIGSNTMTGFTDFADKLTGVLYGNNNFDTRVRSFHNEPLNKDTRETWKRAVDALKADYVGQDKRYKTDDEFIKNFVQTLPMDSTDSDIMTFKASLRRDPTFNNFNWAWETLVTSSIVQFKAAQALINGEWSSNNALKESEMRKNANHLLGDKAVSAQTLKDTFIAKIPESTQDGIIQRLHDHDFVVAGSKVKYTDSRVTMDMVAQFLYKKGFNGEIRNKKSSREDSRLSSLETAVQHVALQQAQTSADIGKLTQVLLEERKREQSRHRNDRERDRDRAPSEGRRYGQGIGPSKLGREVRIDCKHLQYEYGSTSELESLESPYATEVFHL
ncbi:hypothetical protein BCR33DRAFT_722040 [Rhizoclosmatium globosum]|uniref:Uncharacterized protein n=1 Tax=Rhizoclosmatium globosum TaxID=329046 RepID=A0A1Y2BPL2_9FUNG|nr:hypothetical protein BCR33DRAFT_722040 [Rhizoclosmatium globosum]|eukprot:ORY36537.1 hypothetical protein BCR33DRAFT_722040 [Rhizoclosmatium globosum]